MFCGNCGMPIKEGDVFCPNCGASQETREEAVVIDEEVYYSKDWSRAKVFAFVSVPRFDILITKENFYLLKMPSTQKAGLYLIIGLLILNIIGAIIGAMIGDSSDTKKRAKYRSQWLDSNENLTSKEYEKAIHFRIPLTALKNCISFKKGKFVEIVYGSETIVLKKGKEAFKRLEDFVGALPKTYVL